MCAYSLKYSSYAMSALSNAFDDSLQIDDSDGVDNTTRSYCWLSFSVIGSKSGVDEKHGKI